MLITLADVLPHEEDKDSININKFYVRGGVIGEILRDLRMPVFKNIFVNL